MNPRVGNSDPLTPTITLSFTTSGAIVTEYPFAPSAIGDSQMTLPSFTFSATRRASTVPIYSTSPSAANPRLMAPQQLSIPEGDSRLYVHRGRPVFASNAHAWPARPVT